MVVIAPDLIDRTAIIGMGAPFEEAKENARETEHVLEARFRAVSPKLLGCILTAGTEGLRHRRANDFVPRPLPRMADFSEWTYRCEGGLGWERGTILTAYREALTEYTQDIAELDAVAAGLIQFMLGHPNGWRGTITMLGAELNRMDGGVPRAATRRSGTSKSCGRPSMSWGACSSVMDCKSPAAIRAVNVNSR